MGRTSAGGIALSMDLDNDGTNEATFNTSTGFVMQLKVGEITKIETDRDVTAIIYGQSINLKAYSPVAISKPKVPIVRVITDTGNIAPNLSTGITSPILAKRMSIRSGIYIP